jgi:hypothetical protein
MCAIPTAVRVWKVTFMFCSVGLALALVLEVDPVGDIP